MVWPTSSIVNSIQQMVATAGIIRHPRECTSAKGSVKQKTESMRLVWRL
jgi:hypothetical protein